MCAPSVQPGLTSLLARVPAPPRAHPAHPAEGCVPVYGRAQAGGSVGAGGSGAHRGEGFAVGERQGDVKQGPGRAFREAEERPGHTARGGSAVLQPGEPGRSWGSGRSSRRRASEGLAGRCAEGECSRLRGAG